MFPIDFALLAIIVFRRRSALISTLYRDAYHSSINSTSVISHPPAFSQVTGYTEKQKAEIAVYRTIAYKHGYIYDLDRSTNARNGITAYVQPAGPATHVQSI